MPILLIVLLAFGFASSEAFAQLPAESADPNCYFPRFGVKGEIDSIYGSTDQQMMGENFKSIGPSSSYPYNRFVMEGLPLGKDELLEVRGGPNFTLDSLRKASTKPSGYVSGMIIKRGPFRKPGQMDAFVLVGGGIPYIYWADSKGDLSDARRTQLVPQKRGKYHTYYEPTFAYSEYLTSDSVLDVVLQISMSDAFTDPPQSYSYAMLFQGGDALYAQGDTARETQLEFIDSIADWGYTTQANWRGAGRDDLIRIVPNVGHGFFYKNTGQWDFKEFVRALKYDTLWSAHDYPMKPEWVWQLQHITSMRAFPKAPWDRSVDFMPFIPFANDVTADLSFFKGGPDFGSKRLKLDSPRYKIRHPYKYGMDVSWGLSGILDCGDMTGTGNPVIAIGGSPWGSSLVGMRFHYVLGEALDDKVDMFIQEGNQFGGRTDTITADKDRLQDLIVASYYYTSERDAMKGKRTVGSIQIIHGSKKIPVRINPEMSVSRRQDAPRAAVGLYPVPANDHVTVDLTGFDRVERIEIRDILGRLVRSLNSFEPRDELTLEISMLAAGTYTLTAHFSGSASTAKLIVQD